MYRETNRLNIIQFYTINCIISQLIIKLPANYYFWSSKTASAWDNPRLYTIRFKRGHSLIICTTVNLIEIGKKYYFWNYKSSWEKEGKRLTNERAW